MEFANLIIEGEIPRSLAILLGEVRLLHCSDETE